MDFKGLMCIESHYAYKQIICKQISNLIIGNKLNDLSVMEFVTGYW